VLGIMGWWGGKNEGDRYILECLTRYLSEDFKVVPLTMPVPSERETLKLINGLDFLLVGGGGLFTNTPPRMFDTFPEWKSQLKTHFGFVGIGIETVAEAYRRTVADIVSSSSFFVTRDRESFELVNGLGNAEMAPDITFLYPRVAESSECIDRVGVNLRVWNFDKGRTYDAEAWIEEINRLPVNKIKVPLSFLKGLEDNQAMDRVVGIRRRRFTLDDYACVGSFIGMRLHSLIFAVQNGVPAIGIAYAPKVRRFFNAVGLGDYCLSTTGYGMLNERYHSLMADGAVSVVMREYTSTSHSRIHEAMKMVKIKILESV